MAKCRCGREVGCSCKLKNGYCSFCLGRHKKEAALAHKKTNNVKS